MTAAIDLFTLAAADAPSVADEPAYLGPGTPDLLRVYGGPPWPCTTFEYRVGIDPRPCPFCGEKVGDMYCIAIMPDGEWRWAHKDCAVFAKQGKSDMVPGAPWKKRQRGPCVYCGADVDEHVLTNAPTGRFCDATLLWRYRPADEQMQEAA